MQMCGDMKVDACGPAIASCSRVWGDVCVCVCVCTIDVPNCSKYM